MQHYCRQHRADVLRLLVPQAAPCGQVSLQPVEGLAAQAGTLLVVGLVLVLALAATSEGGGAGGVVAVSGARVVRKSLACGERLSIPAGSGGVELLVPHADLGQGESLGSILCLLLSLEERGQPGVEVGQALGIPQLLRRAGGMGPSRVAGTQFVAEA